MSLVMATVRYGGWRGSLSERSLVAEVSLLWRGLLQGRPLNIYRAVLRRVQPASALRRPRGGVSNIGPGATAQDSAPHEGAGDLS
jgi:hypothetical protein